jgi:ankyrin repeat protein
MSEKTKKKTSSKTTTTKQTKSSTEKKTTPKEVSNASVSSLRSVSSIASLNASLRSLSSPCPVPGKSGNFDDDFIDQGSGSFSDLIVTGTASRLNQYGISEEELKKLEPDPENPYKTRYVTINPDDASYASHSVFTHSDLPELNESDAEWLHVVDEDDDMSIASRIKTLNMSTKFQERLRKKGLIESDSESDSDDSIRLSTPVKSPKKIRVAVRKSPTKIVPTSVPTRKAPGRAHSSISVLTINSLSDDAPEEVESKEKKKKTKLKKEDKAKLRKEFFAQINWNPKKKKEKKHYDDAKTRSALEKNPWLAKEKLEVDFIVKGKKSLVYPLSLICALGGTKKTVVLCYAANKEAIRDIDNGLGCPLHYACAFHGEEGMVRFLYKQHPGSLLSAGLNKRTPLHTAAWSETTPVIIHFLAKRCPEALYMEDDQGNRPLHIACREGADLAVIRELAPSSHADVCTTQTKSGATALHLALFHELPFAVIKFLVERNKDIVKKADGKGKLPLHVALAVETTPKETIAFLVEKYPASKKMEIKGKAPYVIAKKHGFPKDVLALLA